MEYQKMAAVDIVKFNAVPDIFAWKFPSEDLSTFTQLIVSETQEAILLKGGQALDTFGPGRHTLESGNIPLLSKFINLPFGGQSAFACEVWFINKVAVLDIKWGTPTPIQLQDPKFKLFISLRSYGQFGIRINDSRKFLLKLVGTVPSFDKANLSQYFKGLYLTKVKDALSSYLVKKQVGILDINASIDELSQSVCANVSPLFNEYGIELLNFCINDISVPENDPAVIQLKNALAKKAEMDIIGYTYAQQRSFDTLEGAATNPGGGQAGLMGAGIGLGMGVGMGGTFGQQMSNMTQNINPSATVKCPKCGADNTAANKFCGICGQNMQEAPGIPQSDTVECSNCKQPIPKNSKFCPTCGDPYSPCMYCGADLKQSESVCSVCGKPAPKPCPKCNSLTNNGLAKFCPQCGQAFTAKCPGCSCEVTIGTKFCPDCGAKL